MKVRFTDKDKELLKYFAHYVWWEDDEYIISNDPLKIVASAMRDANDIPSFLKLSEFSQDVLKQSLKEAQAGWFDPKSWYFWHYRLYGNDTIVPPLPKREFLR